MADAPVIDEGTLGNDVDDAAEWESALEEFAPGYEEKEDSDAKDTTTTETTTAETTTETTTEVETTTATTTVDPNETPEQKVQREKDDAANTAEKVAPDTSLRTARETAREVAKEIETFAKDVREKMFADVPTQLQDKDGDPIKSIQDVMNLINPQTNEAFTEEEAASWLLSAQQQFNQRLAGIDKEVEAIAEVNVDIKDQSDSINYQYGELLKEMPELRDQLWAEYSKTLIIDPATNIITKMPVSLERFYDIALQPYIKLAESLEATQSAKTEADKAQAETKKVQNRADRSDIFGKGKITDTSSDEDKEWSAAFSEYYGDK
jgi:hypothetical protein